MGLAKQPEILSLDPLHIGDVVEDLNRVGRATGTEALALEITAGLEDMPTMQAKEGWAELPAVRNNRVYVVDAGSYTSRSGPRLVTGLEIMAEMIHPELFSGLIPEGAALRLFGDLAAKTE